jgi:NADH:ubiquinone oxidoreductase subunit 6 (subunit J)
MKPLRAVFLVLAIWGAIHPMYWFIKWFVQNEWSIMAMVDAWHANASTTGLVWDLTIAAIALTVFILVETWQKRRFIGLWAIPATFCIGVSCGLPLYLYLRLRGR